MPVDREHAGSHTLDGSRDRLAAGAVVGLGPLADRYRLGAGTGAPSKWTSLSKVAGPLVLHLPARRLSKRLFIPLHDTHFRKPLTFS